MIAFLLIQLYGSIFEEYRGENLYDTMLKINDKRIERYIEYIMVNGGLENSSSIYDGICLDETPNGTRYVSEGNHRILTYKILKCIKDFITSQNTKTINISASINRVLIRDEEQVIKY